jgi:protein transport protein SEC24
MFAALQICIDLFLLAQSYVDIATLATLSHTTGGSMYHYLPFNPMMDQDQLLNDLKWNVSRPQVRRSAAATYQLWVL